MLDLSRNNLLSTAQLVNLCLKGSTWYTWLSRESSEQTLLAFLHPYVSKKYQNHPKGPKKSKLGLLAGYVQNQPAQLANLCLKGSTWTSWLSREHSKQTLLAFLHPYVPKST